MTKKELETPTGKCPFCSINLYGAEKRPKKMPCNIGLGRENNRDHKERGACPYETDEQRQNAMKVLDTEKIAGFLGSTTFTQTYES